MTRDSASRGHQAPQDACSLPLLADCIPLFEVLKDPCRQKLFVRLVVAGELSVNELAEGSALSRTAVSHHLKLLEQHGLVSVRKVGTRRILRPRADEVLGQLRHLVDALQDDLDAARACQERVEP
ncbi:metalloregulator ArsR/SmtB family transcription factor [Kocuria sp.]|uniref:ArsR/SmtB family transcription factor n=1 Tax=Kocuria sp. TaxID=1871328 RepID=UPI0028A1CFC1|nr:metalloregulator ArsR/SmtB family transcription factor [Kocuria sp.]